MSVFTPTALFDRITDITPGFLHSMGVKALLLDIDNTVVSCSSHSPIEGAADWVRAMLATGFEAVVVSNNFKGRVGPIAANFNLPYITFALKPLPFGYLKASRSLKLACSDCVIIGDQIFTDVVGANLCGMRSILLEPIEPESSALVKIKRFFEKSIREKLKSKKTEN